jgi:hypothetical protein
VNTADRRFQLRPVRRVTLFHVVVQHDAVNVVDNLGLVAELDRPVDTALADRPCLRIVQADQTGRRVRLAAAEAQTGLSGHPRGSVEERAQLVDRADQPTPGASADPGQPAAGITGDRGRLGGGLIDQLGQFTGDTSDGGLRLQVAVLASI